MASWIRNAAVIAVALPAHVVIVSVLSALAVLSGGLIDLVLIAPLRGLLWLLS